MVSRLTKFSQYACWFPGVIALLAFVATLSPGLLPSDAGEYQLVIAEWGVAHPPGYALYTLLAGGFARVMPFDFALSTNLFSALVAALTVTLTAYIAQRETGNVFAGWLAGFALLASASFWMTATQASIRPLTVFFAAAMLEAVLAYRRQQQRKGQTTWPLLRFGAAAGLGVTHHGSLLFVGLVFAAALALLDLRAWRRWPLAVLSAAIIGALPWLYLLLTPNAPDSLQTWGGFWHYVLARGFSGDLFAHAGVDAWGERGRVLLEIYRLQWDVWLLLAGLVALVFGLLRDRWLFGLLMAGAAVHTFVSVTYRAPQTAEYALPAYLLLALGLGVCTSQVLRCRDAIYGIRYALGRGRAEARPHKRFALFAFAAVMVIVACIGIVRSVHTNALTWGRYAQREEARDAALATLTQAPPNAVILTQWHRATPLFYLHRVENVRPDVHIEYVFPRGDLSPTDNWTQRIEAHVAAGRDVLVTQFFPEAYRFLPYAFAGQRVLPELQAATASDYAAGYATFTAPAAQRITLISADPATDRIRLGETLQLDLTWQLDAPVNFGDLTTFVHLSSMQAPPLAQQDIALQAPNVSADADTLTLTYDVQVPQTVPPGEYALAVGAYTSQGVLRNADGQERIEVARVQVLPGDLPLPTQNPLHVAADGLSLRGYDADVTPGRVRLYLHWQVSATTSEVTILHHEQVLAVIPIAPAQAGYWTSVYDLPPDLAASGLRLQFAGRAVDLPPIQQGRYIPFGDVAVLVDAQVRLNEPQAMIELELTWLPLGATYKDMHTVLSAAGANWRETQNELPVAGSLPSSKWVYGRPLRTHHAFDLPGTLQSIRLQLADGFTQRTEAVYDRLHNADGLGVRLYP